MHAIRDVYIWYPELLRFVCTNRLRKIRWGATAKWPIWGHCVTNMHIHVKRLLFPFLNEGWKWTKTSERKKLKAKSILKINGDDNNNVTVWIWYASSLRMRSGWGIRNSNTEETHDLFTDWGQSWPGFLHFLFSWIRFCQSKDNCQDLARNYLCEILLTHSDKHGGTDPGASNHEQRSCSFVRRKINYIPLLTSVSLNEDKEKSRSSMRMRHSSQNIWGVNNSAGQTSFIQDVATLILSGK